MKRCPTCDGPCELVETSTHPVYHSMMRLDVQRIQLHAIEQFVRCCEARSYAYPSLPMTRVIHEELVTVERVLTTYYPALEDERG